MSRYEQAFDSGWDSLEKDGATDRAYAIGVAERLGEFNREELEEIYAEMDTAYDRSMVELAYEEGRNEAKEAGAAASDADDIWAELVEGEKVYVDPDELPNRGRDGLPPALDQTELLDKQDVDSTDVVDRPKFLDR